MDAEYLEFETSLYRTNPRQTLPREVLTSDIFYSVGSDLTRDVSIDEASNLNVSKCCAHLTKNRHSPTNKSDKKFFTSENIFWRYTDC